MAEEHPNISLIKRLNPQDLGSATDLFAEDVVFHYFNPKLPDLQGDYMGVDGVRKFFQAIGAKSRGTFHVEPRAVTAVGNELVVVQTRNTMTLDGEPIAIDVVLVWRIVEGRIAEVWDIPSVYTLSADTEEPPSPVS